MRFRRMDLRLLKVLFFNLSTIPSKTCFKKKGLWALLLCRWCRTIHLCIKKTLAWSNKFVHFLLKILPAMQGLKPHAAWALHRSIGQQKIWLLSPYYYWRRMLALIHSQNGKRYVAVKHYIIVHNGGLEQYWVKSFGTTVRTISGNVPTNFELQRLKGTLLLKWGEMAAYNYKR